MAAVVLLAGEQVWADGCFISVKETVLGQSKSLVTSPKQEAILATDGQTVQVVLRTHFNAGPKELAWVIPVPEVPDDVRKADDAVFERLDAMTAPTFTKYEETPREDDGGGLAFGCGMHSNGLGGAIVDVPLGVRVEKAGTAGIFDFQVVSAKRAEDLLQWLDQHNYNPPQDAAKVFAPYIAKGWHWLAIRVRAEEANRATLAPHPISYCYKSRHLVFPLIISSLSSADETEIVLYVVGQGYFGPSTWASCTCEDLAGRPRDSAIVEQKGSPSGTNYEELLRHRAHQAAGHLLVTEFTQQWQLFGTSASMGRRFDDVLEPNMVASIGPRQAIVRLRACVRREQMDQDIALEPKPDMKDVVNQIQIIVTRPATAAASRPVKAGGAILSLVAMSACAAGTLGGRRRRVARVLRVALVVGGLAILMLL
jgi:hypothetical protein